MNREAKGGGSRQYGGRKGNGASTYQNWLALLSSIPHQSKPVCEASSGMGRLCGLSRVGELILGRMPLKRRQHGFGKLPLL